MSVVTAIEELDGSTRELRIRVPEQAVQAEQERVLQAYRKRARISGFRPGKAPAELVRKKFGEEIREEVLEQLVPRYWQQAQSEKELEPLLPARVGDVELAGDQLSFTARVEVRPEIELKRLDGFELPDPPVEPSREEVDQALNDLRRDAGTWEAVERAAARGDLVKVRIQEITEAEPDAPLEEQEPVALEVGDERVWPELSLAMSGLSAGGRGEFTRAKEGEATPEDAPEETPDEPPEEAEQPGERRFRLLVDEVSERSLPELDDEFAARVGEFESLKELRHEVIRQLEAGKLQERRGQRERALLDQLRDRYPVELSERLVHHELEQMASDYAGGLARRGVDPSRAEIDWEEFAREMTPQAQRRVHARVLLDLAADQREVRLEGDELEEALSEIARMEGSTTPQIRQRLSGSGHLGELERQLRRQKVLRLLLGEEEPEASGAGAAGEEPIAEESKKEETGE